MSRRKPQPLRIFTTDDLVSIAFSLKGRSTPLEELNSGVLVGEVPLTVIDPRHIHIKQQGQVVVLLRRGNPNPVWTITEENLTPDHRQEQIRITEKNPVDVPQQCCLQGELSPSDQMYINFIASATFRIEQSPSMFPGVYRTELLCEQACQS